MNASEKFSDYLLFVDESGDHSLDAINPENPVFVLAFCLFKKSEYFNIINPLITQFKLNFWGHDLIILHNHAIRKYKGEFSFLFNQSLRENFLGELNEIITQIPFHIVSSSIDKRSLVNGAQIPNNPYYLALEFCLEHVFRFLEKESQLDRLTHIIVESRGKVEDKDLRVAFDTFVNRSFLIDNHCPFSLRFADKKVNSSGLQIADLVAYPIARYSIKPDQPRRDFEIVKRKLLHYLEWDEVGSKKLFSF